jgi:hypothetical protein
MFVRWHRAAKNMGLAKTLKLRGLPMRQFIALMFAMGMMCPIPGRASTVVAVPEEELTALSDAVVWSQVIDTNAFVDAQNRIVTRVRLRVAQGYAGARQGDTLTLYIPGGRLKNGLTTVVAGAPEMTSGDMVLAFLQKHGETHYVPVGMSYGVLKGHQDSAGHWRVSRNMAELTLVDRKGQVVTPASVSVNDELLDEISARVKAHVAKIRAAKQGGRP